MPKIKNFKIPFFGRAAIGLDPNGSSDFKGGIMFQTETQIRVLRGAEYDEQGRPVHGTGHYVPIKDVVGTNWFERLLAKWRYRDGRTTLDLGTGAVTNVGVLALANDWNWSVTNAPNNIFRFMKYMASGTGSTAAAGTDIKLQTPSGFGGQTPVVATQSLVSAANLQKYQLVGTITYTGTETVAELGIFAYDSTLPATSALSDATGSPFTAGSGTTGTVTGTPLTANSTTVMGQQLSIFENTGNATPSWGLVLSNTTSVVTVPAWYKVADGTAGANPANTNTYVIRPVMFDHKVFTGIGVNNTDSIQYTWALTIVSGG